MHIREDVQARDLPLARSISQEVQLFLTEALNTVEGPSAYPGVIDADSEAMDEVFCVALDTARDVNLVYRLDSDGNMLNHCLVEPTSAVGNDFSFRDPYQRTLTADQHVKLVLAIGDHGFVPAEGNVERECPARKLVKEKPVCEADMGL